MYSTTSNKGFLNKDNLWIQPQCTKPQPSTTDKLVCPNNTKCITFITSSLGLTLNKRHASPKSDCLSIDYTSLKKGTCLHRWSLHLLPNIPMNSMSSALLSIHFKLCSLKDEGGPNLRSAGKPLTFNAEMEEYGTLALGFPTAIAIM